MTLAPDRVLVGYDGSPDADLALQWAVDAVRADPRPLTVVIARGDLFTVSRFADEWTRGLAEEWAARARSALAGMGVTEPDVQVLDGLAAGVLTAESSTASLVVLGSHGHGLLRRTLQGSVSQHVSRQAGCPVVVVRPVRDPRSRSVVVGVDGSPTSLQALEFGLRHAAAHDLEVVAGHCDDYLSGYSDPRLPGTRPWLIPEISADLELRAREVRRRIHEVGALQPEARLRVVDWTARPGPALSEASQHAALVVVGARGLGEFAGLLLGSVSTEVLRSAACPVAVVR